MDAGQVSQLFRSGDWVAVIVIVVPAVAWCAKEMFGAIRARDQRRREFLDLWIRKEHHDDDLWLEGIVLYGYGVTLSAATIRHITSRDKPMQRLRAFAMNHAYFVLIVPAARSLGEIGATTHARAECSRTRGCWLPI